MVKQLSILLCSSILVTCILVRAAFASTEILEFVHPLMYSSIVNSTQADSSMSSRETCRTGTSSGDVEGFQWVVNWLFLIGGGLVTKFLDLYSISLESNPVITKSITASLMGAVGDIFAQAVETWTNGEIFERRRINARRVFAIAAEGLLVSGPLMHYSYEVLEAYLPIYEDETESNDLHSWYMTICQVIIDAIVMDSIFVATMMVTSALLEGRRKEIRLEMATGYVPAVKVSWFNSLCWAPIQCLSFKYIPFNYRVLAVNMQDIAWNASVSFMAHRTRPTRIYQRTV